MARETHPEMTGRHLKERQQMHTRHERERREMNERHAAEVGGEPVRDEKQDQGAPEKTAKAREY